MHLFFLRHFMKFAFMCHKKCFGISDRFIRSKDTTPSLLHFPLPIFFSFFSGSFCSFGSQPCGIADIRVKKDARGKESN